MSKRTSYSFVSLFTDNIMLLTKTPEVQNAILKMNHLFYCQFEDGLMMTLTEHGGKSDGRIHLDVFVPSTDDAARLDRMESWVRGYLASFVSNTI